MASDGHGAVVGMCIQPDQFRPTTATISKLHRGDIDPEPLVTDAIGLGLLPDRFEALKRPTTERKVLIEP